MTLTPDGHIFFKQEMFNFGAYKGTPVDSDCVLEKNKRTEKNEGLFDIQRHVHPNKLLKGQSPAKRLAMKQWGSNRAVYQLSLDGRRIESLRKLKLKKMEMHMRVDEIE